MKIEANPESIRIEIADTPTGETGGSRSHLGAIFHRNAEGPVLLPGETEAFEVEQSHLSAISQEHITLVVDQCQYSGGFEIHLITRPSNLASRDAAPERYGHLETELARRVDQFAYACTKATDKEAGELLGIGVRGFQVLLDLVRWVHCHSEALPLVDPDAGTEGTGGRHD